MIRPQEKRLQYITRNYSFLQGLTLLPFGVYMLLSGIWDTWLYYIVFPAGESLPWDPLIFVLLPLGITFAFIQLAARYYRRTFGTVQPESSIAQRFSTGLWMTIVLLLIAISLDSRLHPHVIITGLAIVALLFLRWWQFDRVPGYYLALAAIVLIASIVPLFSKTAYNLLFLNIHAPDAYQDILLGPLLIVIGILDHLYLMRTLAKVRTASQQEVLHAPF